MVAIRLGRGGLFFLLRSDAGQGSIGLSHSREDPGAPLYIRCSLVGLRTVLNGLEYVAADQGRHCSVKRIGGHIEMVWHAGDKFQTVIRVTTHEFEQALDSLNGKLPGADRRRAA
jgi:hypothetical protein